MAYGATLRNGLTPDTFLLPQKSAALAARAPFSIEWAAERLSDLAEALRNGALLRVSQIWVRSPNDAACLSTRGPTV